MDEILRKRIERKRDGLPEDKGYQVLDYIEFLESKYGTTARQPTPIERITEGVGDTLRVVRAPAEAIRGAMGGGGRQNGAGRPPPRPPPRPRGRVPQTRRRPTRRTPAAPLDPSRPERITSA